MATYEKITFVDHVTPLNAENMNHLEDGIAQASSSSTSELSIGTVTSGDAASATITDGKLNLVLPKGDKGDKGDPGKDGAQGAPGAAGTDGKDGADGAKGDKGDPGAAGADGKNGATWFVEKTAQSAGGAAPSGAVAGDLVLDANGKVFKVNASNTLDDTTVNIKGAAGTPGAKGDPGEKGDPGASYTLPAANTTTLGGVKQAAAQADSTASDAAGLVTDFNALLAKLRSAGILANA